MPGPHRVGGIGAALLAANVIVAGELKNPQSMREPLRRLVAQALARLVP